MAHHNRSLFILATVVVLAASSTSHAETGRYTMTPTKDGVLKLDTKTGAVSLCRSIGTGWSCKGVDDSNKGLRGQLHQLEKENARLRARLNKQQLAPDGQGGPKIEMPSEEDVDKAMDFMQRLLGRFKGMVEELKKDKKNSDEDGVPL